ncbi:MAG: recombinase family protein [Actinomycetota bacterium]|nr:recombinase family protein [Actinomycetota bacterium]
MNTQKVGYVRVSSLDQNPDRQLENLKLDRVFIDKASGRDTVRTQLTEMLAYVREGDTIVVHSMDRLARNLLDLRTIVQDLTRRGVRVEFVKEALTFTGDDSPMSHLLLSVMGAVAEFERELIRERQREGIAMAKKRGAYKGRRKALNKVQIEELSRRIDAGESKANLIQEFGITRQTLYRYLGGNRAGVVSGTE